MKPYSLDLRQKIIETYEENNLSQRELAKRFRVALSFIQKLIKQWRETGNLNPRPHGGGQKLKLKSDEIILLGDLVQEKKDATLDELRKQIEEKTQTVVSNSTISRILKRLNLTQKKSLHARERDTERVQKLREEYWEKIRDVRAEDLVFVDESGSNLGMTRLYGRAEKGQRVYDSVPLNRGKNVTIIGAIALKGLLAFINVFGAANGLIFEAFIATLLVPNLWKGACVLMDNASIHQKETLEPILQEVGARLEFLPPYSPDFSPIENCWSKVKILIRSMSPRTYADLEKAIVQAFSQITLRDIHHWFTHCCYCDTPFKEPT